MTKAVPLHAQPRCRYDSKRRYASRKEAREGAEHIRVSVEGAGGIYGTLYPYLCPDNEHWHLSHYQQGYTTCPVCETRQSAWKGGIDYWVVNAHDAEGIRCSGEGKHVCTG